MYLTWILIATAIFFNLVHWFRFMLTDDSKHFFFHLQFHINNIKPNKTCILMCGLLDYFLWISTLVLTCEEWLVFFACATCFSVRLCFHSSVGGELALLRLSGLSLRYCHGSSRTRLPSRYTHTHTHSHTSLFRSSQVSPLAWLLNKSLDNWVCVTWETWTVFLTSVRLPDTRDLFWLHMKRIASIFFFLLLILSSSLWWFCADSFGFPL